MSPYPCGGSHAANAPAGYPSPREECKRGRTMDHGCSNRWSRTCRWSGWGDPLMTRRMASLAAFAAAFFLLGTSAQAAPPDYSGEWQLNGAKSDFGKFPAPQSINRKIAHQGVKLSITNVQKGAQGE